MNGLRARSVIIVSLLTVLVCVIACGGNSSFGPAGPQVPQCDDITGEYRGNFTYHFTSTTFSAAIEVEQWPFPITQSGCAIEVRNCPGTLEGNRVEFGGHLISFGGTQQFVGTYDESAGTITGDFVGATVESDPWGGRASGLVSNASFTLTRI